MLVQKPELVKQEEKINTVQKPGMVEEEEKTKEVRMSEARHLSEVRGELTPALQLL